MTKRKNFSKNAIVDHWLDDDRFIMVMTDVCWICGTYTRFTQKCHIQSLYSGGSDSLDNLVLLCPNCHKFTEGLQPDQFWFFVEAYPHDFFTHILSRWFASGQVSKGTYKYWKDYMSNNTGFALGEIN